MILGAIADDLTGATDLALTLSRGGLRTVMTAGVPETGIDPGNADAVVVALKSRTIPVDDAVRLSLNAASALRAAGARRYFFKYCSTFDSTAQGNIGPVAEALLDFCGGEATVACPAFPATGRTVYLSHLFVNGVPLHESPMRNHPLTPMRDSNLVRVLAPQTRLTVGQITYPAVTSGEREIKDAFRDATAKGVRILVADALRDEHLVALGAALAENTLLTGGSGLAIGLPAAYTLAGLLADLRKPSVNTASQSGRRVILAGSCSQMTLAQVNAALSAGTPAFKLDPITLAAGKTTVDDVLTWTEEQAGDPLLIYASAPPDVLARTQAELGAHRAATIVEETLSSVARALVERGFDRLIVAGGETSGAVIDALSVGTLAIGPEIAPGVPWMLTGGGRPLALALKSGNFGGPDFFLTAWRALERSPPT